MTLQLIDLSTPGTGLGDPLRDGGVKINANFTELYALLSQTVSAGDSAFGGSVENRVQLAIDHAAGTGKKRVIVPQVMLPYNASLITFNNTVQMTREGGWDIAYDVDAYGAYGDDSTDDSASFQAAFNGLPSVGGIVQMGPKTYRAMNIAPPLTASYDVLGAGRTASIVKPPALTPANPIFDLSNSSGPAKTFRGFKLEGANPSLFESTGIKMNASNGVVLRDLWGAGLLIGVDFNNSSYLDSLGCVFESCGLAFWLQSFPEETMIVDTTYYSNAQDLQVTGDCSTFIHKGSTSINCSNLSTYLLNATNFSMSDFAIRTAATALNITNSPDASFSHGKLTANTTDISSNTARTYFHDVQMDYTPISAAGYYQGVLIGGKRFVTSVGAPTTLTWDAGDRWTERAPAIGSPKGGLCTVGGPPGTWVSEGNL